MNTVKYNMSTPEFVKECHKVQHMNNTKQALNKLGHALMRCPLFSDDNDLIVNLKFQNHITKGEDLYKLPVSVIHDAANGELYDVSYIEDHE